MRCRFLTLACAAIAAQAQTAIDFSYAGYGGRGVALPTVAAVVSVRPGGRDDGSQLQQAIDSVSAMTLNKDGFHGAIQLLAGRYRVAGPQIKAAGVVLRGIGDAVIVATGSSRRTLLNIVGRAPATDAPVAITGEAVPAGSLTFGVTDTSPFHAGDRVVITRPSTAEWITALHMRGLPGTYANQRLDWAPGSRDLVWDRNNVQVDPATKRVTVDAPITTALESRYGGGTVARVNLKCSGRNSRTSASRISPSKARLRPAAPRRRSCVDRDSDRQRRRCLGP